MEEHEETIGVFIALTSETHLFTKVQSSPLNGRKEYIIELARQHKFDSSKVVSIEADVIRLLYDFAGGGLYGVDKEVRTKEQAG